MRLIGIFAGVVGAIPSFFFLKRDGLVFNHPKICTGAFCLFSHSRHDANPRLLVGVGG